MEVMYIQLYYSVSVSLYVSASVCDLVSVLILLHKISLSSTINTSNSPVFNHIYPEQSLI
jgi:hypothetical protein